MGGMRSTLPGWLKDQMAAAAAENTRALLEVGMVVTVSKQTERRLDAVAVEAMENWSVKPCFCEHLTSIQPSFLPMARPTAMLCRACLIAYATVQQYTVEDNTCDLCRRVAGTAGVLPFAVSRAHVTVLGGACRACWNDPSFDE